MLKTVPSSKLVDLGLVGLYLVAIVCANSAVAEWGQTALVFTALFLIPFDLLVRDLLQDRWQSEARVCYWMGALIVSGGVVSVITTVAPMRICVASIMAFVLTGGIDAAIYQWAIRRGRTFRIGIATIIGSIIDTIVFVVVAFDCIDWLLVTWQVCSKLMGGLFWGWFFFDWFRGECDVHAEKRNDV